MDSNEIKELRRELSLTQDNLAAALNVSVATVNRWENKADDRNEVPEDVKQLLIATQHLVNTVKTDPKLGLTSKDIKQAILSPAGISGFVGASAKAGLLPAMITCFLMTPGLGWIAAIAAGTVFASVPFFKKIQAQSEAEKNF